MHADRRLDRAVADVVDVAEAERDAATGLEDPAAQPRAAGGELLGTAGVVVLAAGGPAPLGQPAAHDGQRAERAAVVVQLGGLVAGPGDQPDVEVLVGVQALRPAVHGVDLDRVAAGVDLVGHLTGEGDEVGEARRGRAVLPAPAVGAQGAGTGERAGVRGCVDQGGHDGRSSGCGRPRAHGPRGQGGIGAARGRRDVAAGWLATIGSSGPSTPLVEHVRAAALPEGAEQEVAHSGIRPRRRSFVTSGSAIGRAVGGPS